MLDRRSAIRAGLGAVLLGKALPAQPKTETVFDMAYVDRHGPIQVFDANGIELKYLLRCVVETGEVTQLVRDGVGFVLDREGMEIARQQAWYPAPLRIVHQGESQ
jgi:hypothetical protein